MIRFPVVRRAAPLGLVAVLSGGAGATVNVACGSFGESASVVPDAASDVVVATDADQKPDAEARACPPGAFCDSFDDGAPLTPRWRVPTPTGGASLAVVAGAGVDNSSALVATLANNNSIQSAYLVLDVGPKSANYDVVLAFSARVMTTGTGFVLGPRFFGNDADGRSRDLIIDWHASLIRLDRFVPTCDGGCLVSAKDTPVDASWHTYVLTVKVRDASSGDNGSFVFELDGKPIDVENLPFSLSSPTKAGLQLGVTYANGKAGGTIAFDDVSLLVTAR